MARTRYRYIDGKLQEVSGDPGQGAGITIIPDLPDHVSPITGEVIHGRAARREHMRIHDVIDAREVSARARGEA